MADIIADMLNDCGMSDTLGLISARNIKPGLEMQQKLDMEKKQILESCYENVMGVLKTNKKLFDKVLETLMKKGTDAGEEFIKLVKK